MQSELFHTWNTELSLETTYFYVIRPHNGMDLLVNISLVWQFK